MTLNLKNKPLVVLVDFDGTITTQDIGDKVVEKFAEPGWRSALEWFRSGEISARGFWAHVTGFLREDREAAAVAHSLSIAEIRPSFGELLSYCESQNIPVEVVSSGIHFYVDAILGKFNMADLPRSRPVVEYDGDGHGVMIIPKGLRDCGMTMMCKCDRVWNWRRKGYRVMFVGDGVSDACVVSQADVVLATSNLLNICKTQGIDHTPFDTFHEVLEVIRG
jgi:2,3-diketo-5-methylthio-1-phosphopentane phosphatase